MLGGYYTIASGMMTRQREMDVIGSNLTNSQTPGYRGEKMITSAFEQELLTRQEKYNTATLGQGKMATAAMVEDVVSVFNSGNIKTTGRSLDMAINGEGFFNVKGADGVTYLTRGGQFDLNAEGALIVPNLGKVLSDNGEEILLENDKFFVDELGTIFTFDEENEQQTIAKLMISAPENLQDLVMENNGMFRMENGETAPQSQTYTIEQGNIELSNINMNHELTQLIAAQRGFQSCSSALQTMDALNRKAVSQLGAI